MEDGVAGEGVEKILDCVGGGVDAGGEHDHGFDGVGFGVHAEFGEELAVGDEVGAGGEGVGFEFGGEGVDAGADAGFEVDVFNWGC